MERFGPSGAAGRITRTCSGGIQRQLDVAMGPVHRRRVLFLDGPTTGLDPEARGDMWREISTLTREEGLKVLLTTHYLEERWPWSASGFRPAPTAPISVGVTVSAQRRPREASQMALTSAPSSSAQLRK